MASGGHSQPVSPSSAERQASAHDLSQKRCTRALPRLPIFWNHEGSGEPCLREWIAASNLAHPTRTPSFGPRKPFRHIARFSRVKLVMNYLGPSRVHARAGHNPWPALTAAERKKLADGGPECKRMVGCLERVAPVLEGAAHRILQDDWKQGIWNKAKITATLLLLLFLIGGYALAYEVATSDSYTAAAEHVYNTLSGKGPDQPFPITATSEAAYAQTDPGAPSWFGSA